jgi:hypothetical protein
MHTTKRSANVRHRFTAAALALSSLLTASSAFAQAPPMTPPPGSEPAAAPSAPAPAPAPTPYPQYPQYPAPSYATAPNGQYVAPLSQTVQPSYVPQSVALSGPRMIKDWRDGDPIPWGYHRETRVRAGQVVAGSILFGVPYLYSSLLASASSDFEGDDYDALWIPVLGPLIQLKDSDSTTFSYVLVLDALAQGIGAWMAISAVASPKAVLVRNDLGLALAPAPMGKDGTGLMMMGRF